MLSGATNPLTDFAKPLVLKAWGMVVVLDAWGHPGGRDFLGYRMWLVDHKQAAKGVQWETEIQNMRELEGAMETVNSSPNPKPSGETEVHRNGLTCPGAHSWILGPLIPSSFSRSGFPITLCQPTWASPGSHAQGHRVARKSQPIPVSTSTLLSGSFHLSSEHLFTMVP